MPDDTKDNAPKDHMGWPDRPAVQKRIESLCATDPQHIFNVISEVLTPDQKAKVFERWCPPIPDEERKVRIEVLEAELAVLRG